MIDKINFAKKLVDLRNKCGLSQSKLADMLYISGQAVSKWENDISCPDIAILPQVADYFSVSMDRLIRGEEPMRPQVLQGKAKKDFNSMILRITVDSSNGDRVKVNLPMALAKVALEMGMPFASSMNFGNNESANSALKQVDFSQIITLVESGMVGTILEVDSADGDKVRIFVE